jgi:hypothetical protein
VASLSNTPEQQVQRASSSLPHELALSENLTQSAGFAADPSPPVIRKIRQNPAAIRFFSGGCQFATVSVGIATT